MLTKLGRGLSPLARASFKPAYSRDFTIGNSSGDFLIVRATSGLYYNGASYQQAGVNAARFHTDPFTGQQLGLLAEKRVVSRNLYLRPSAGTVGDHFSSGSGSVSIVTDSTNPFNALTNGNNVWEIDNSAGESDVTVEFDGATTNTAVHSIQLWVKVTGGVGGEISFSGAGAKPFNHSDWFLVKSDNITPGSAFHNDSEGTYIMEFQIYGRGRYVGIPRRILKVDNGSSDNDHIEMQLSNTVTRVAMTVRDNGTYSASINHSFTEREEFHRFGFSYIDSGALTMAADGAVVATDPSINAPDDITNLGLFYDKPNNFMIAAGIVRNVKYFSTARSDADLESLTNIAKRQLVVAIAGGSNASGMSTNSNASGIMERTLRAHYLDVTVISAATEGLAANSLADSGAGYMYNNSTTAIEDEYTETFLAAIDAAVAERDLVDLVIWAQGEQDGDEIAAATLTKAQYKTAVQAIFDEMRSDIGSHLKIAVRLAGRKDTAGSESGWQDVNDALRETANENSWCSVLSESYDIDIENDDLHTLAGYNALAVRETNRALALMGKASESGTVGPVVTSATQNGANIDLTIAHDAGSDITVPAGAEAMFRVEDDATPVTVSAAARLNANTVRLSLATAPTGTVQIFTAYGTMSGMVNTSAPVIRDNAAIPLPLRSGVITAT